MNKDIFQQYTEFIKKQNNLSNKVIKQHQENLIDTYLKLSNLINEQDEDLEEDDLEQGDDNLQDDDSENTEDSEDSEDTNETTTQESNEQQTDDNADLKFSADLASEFGNTVNQFTKVAAEVVKQRSINKETSDKIYDLMAKIKNLLDAAGKSI